MKLLSVALSISCFLGTLCTSMPTIDPSDKKKYISTPPLNDPTLHNRFGDLQPVTGLPFISGDETSPIILPIHFLSPRFAITANGPLPEKMDLPDAKAGTDYYVLFSALIPYKGQDVYGWILAAIKYSNDGKIWRPAQAPVYYSHAKIRDGAWINESRKIVRDNAVRSLTQRHMPLAYVPLEGVEGMFSEIEKVSLDGLPVDEEQGKLDWTDRVMNYLRDLPPQG